MKTVTRGRVIVALMLLSLAALGVVYFLSRRPPSWWNPPIADEPSALALAESFEQRFAGEVSRVRPDEAPWAVRIGEDQLNAWLALRLPRWLEHAGAPAEAMVQAHVRDGAIELAVRPSPTSAVGVVEATPTLRDGALSLTISRVGLGAIGLPGASADLIVATLESLADVPDQDDTTHAALALLRGRNVPAQVDLGDGRRVELLDIELRRGEIIAQLRTLTRREPAPPRPR